MKIIFLLILLGFSNLIYSQEFPVLKGDYLGQTPPGIIPEVFAPGLVSVKNRMDMGCSFSPDGKEFAFGIWGNDKTASCIYFMEQKNRIWSEPVIASFIGLDSVFLPMFSPDGKSLTFIKNQPNSGRTDIWICNRTNNGWTVPERFPSPVNSELREASNGLTMSRTLYFTSNRDTVNKHCGNIFRSKPIKGEYLTVERQDNLNTPFDEEGLFISPNEDYIIVQSWQGNSGHDLYISYTRYDNTWSKPEKLDSSINSSNIEQRPYISPDKKYLFFTRSIIDKQYNPLESDIYWVSTKKVFKPYTFHPISDTIIIKGNRYKYSLPINTFKDINGGKLKYSASLNNGKNLPKWLKFNNTTQTFSGAPNEIEELKIKITAIDDNKNTNSMEFKIVIKE
jgi:hypothetical protein